MAAVSVDARLSFNALLFFITSDLTCPIKKDGLVNPRDRGLAGTLA